MSGLVPYLSFAGNARQALTFYQSVFGGDLALHTYADFGRADGPPEAIAHGMVSGVVDIFGADAAAGEKSLALEGILFSLLGTSDPETLTSWFDALSVGGEVTDPLQKREWGDHDGQVIDQFGVKWLIGYEG